MIGPTSDYRELDAMRGGVERYLRSEKDVPVPAPEELDRFAELVGSSLGIQFQPAAAYGAFHLIAAPDSTSDLERQVQLERQFAYVLVTPNEVHDGVRAVVEYLHAKFGPGRAWTTAGRVRLVKDDGMVVCADIDGEPHLLLRSFVFHENGVAS